MNFTMNQWNHGYRQQNRSGFNTQNKGKSIVAERFIRTLKNKICIVYISCNIKNGYIDQLDDVIDKYSNTYHRTIKMKSIDVKTSAYVTFNIENNGKYPKFKIGDHVK